MDQQFPVRLGLCLEALQVPCVREQPLEFPQELLAAIQYALCEDRRFEHLLHPSVLFLRRDHEFILTYVTANQQGIHILP